MSDLPTIFEDWSGRRLSKRPPWTAERVFSVEGAFPYASVLDTLGLPREKDPHPENPALICDGTEIIEVPGPLYFKARSTYSYKSPESNGVPCPDDPLNMPIRIRWENIELSVLVDHDLDGNLIQNAACEKLDPVAREVTVKRLTIARNEPYYDVAKSTLFENTTNSNPMTVNGVLVPAQHMKCCSMLPTRDFHAGAPFIEIAYVFEVIFGNALGELPFQHRFVNCGQNGWYSDSGTNRVGRFVDGLSADAQPIDRKVLLDLTGVPFGVDSGIKVGPNSSSPIAAPTTPTFYAKSGSTVNGISIPDLSTYKTIFFKKTAVVDFNGLGLTGNGQY